MRADAGQLRRALLNLARNAVAAARSVPNAAGERPRVILAGGRSAMVRFASR